MSADANALGAWAGIIFYAFQIYFDFSGYSDMAIGLGKMMGFRFKENFFYPYMSESVTEFWRRWHISLGTWFREYVYIPLGGNRRGTLRTYRNILVVWFLTGLWHGASWNYIVWGLYYCALLIIEKTFLLKAAERLPSALRRAATLFFVLIGWLIFVFEDMGAGLSYLTYMFGAAPAVAGAALYDVVRTLPFLAVLVIASTPLPKKLFWRLWEKGEAVRCALSAGSAAMLVLCVAYLVDSSYNPFLYFRF
jgi:alginate O-acetyltransferase complex protein AlgI